MKDKILKKTREVLRELKKQNEISKYGRPIPDSVWNEIAKEHSRIAKELGFYRFFLIAIILGIIFISSYLLL